ncbi:MAG: outer membrane lipoprotein-sorting protein [Spirochaetota bacterium]
MKRFFIIVTLMSAVAAAVFGQDTRAILAELDELGNFEGKDFSALYTIVSQKPGEKDAVTQVRIFRRDAKDQFTFLIMLPEVNKGQAYLREGDNIWFYDPTSRKFSFSSMKENIQDSEAKNSDLSRSTLSEDYSVSSVMEGKLGQISVWIIDLQARTQDVSYERLVLHVRKDRTVLLKEEAYSVSGRLMRTTLYPKYAELDGKLLPTQILIVDALNPGERSQLSLAEQSVAPIPDRVFTKAFLEQVNR